MGVLAAVVYGTLGWVGLPDWDRLWVWRDAHPVLEGVLVTSVNFLAVAMFTDLPAAVCGLIGVGLWLLLLPLSRLTSRRARNRRDSS